MRVRFVGGPRDGEDDVMIPDDEWVIYVRGQTLRTPGVRCVGLYERQIPTAYDVEHVPFLWRGWH